MELEYFTIDGEIGGNQDWFTNIVMRIGGCAAAAACDSSIYFAERMGMEYLYPYDIHALNKEDYKKFSQKMKPYIRPRRGGVSKLEWYVEGYGAYIRDVEASTRHACPVRMDCVPGNCMYDEAAAGICRQIEKGLPVPYLLLKHQNTERYRDFIWHWFMLIGCEEQEDDMLVTAATYGEKAVFSLRDLWNTGHEEKGGYIRYSLETESQTLRTGKYPLK